jgi:hypothetical protein
MNRGQGSIEYLMILAIVVVIAITVISVVGVPNITFNRASQLDSAQYFLTSEIGIPRYYLTSYSSTSELTIKNNENFQICLVNITFDNKNGIDHALSWNGTDWVLFDTTKQFLGLGQTIRVFLTEPECDTPGRSFSKSFAATYTIGTICSTGMRYNFIGIEPFTGTCQ